MKHHLEKCPNLLLKCEMCKEEVISNEITNHLCTFQMKKSILDLKKNIEKWKEENRKLKL